MLARLTLIACLLLAPQVAQPPPASADGIDALVAALQTAIGSGDPAAIKALARPDASVPPLAEFIDNMTAPRPSFAVVKERDRSAIGGGRARLLVEIFVESQGEGRVSTWRIDAAPPRAAGPPASPWEIAQIEKLTVINGLYQLSLDPKAEYDVHNLVIQEPDLTLTIPAGHAFVAPAQGGPTALVLVGKGKAVFAPRPAAERGQVRQFSGSEALTTEFDSLFIRLNPGIYAARVPAGAFSPRTLNPRDLRKASDLFQTLLPFSFQIDLGDLSTSRWSLIPTGNDAVVEINTRKYGTLTYAQATTQPEDISLFDRRHKKNIALYASEAKLAARGPFYSDDEDADFDVTHYDLHTVFSPDRLWVDGVARVSLTTRSPSSGTLTLRLADSLVVRSISSPMFGRLLHLRVVGQNSVLVGFPSMLPAGTDLDLVVTYGGRLQPQALDREAITVQQQDVLSEPITMPPEPNFIYSNRSYWYPQSTTTDYATATMAISVPSEFDAIASGTPAGAPKLLQDAEGQTRKEYVFQTSQPARYLSCIISRFSGKQTTKLNLALSDQDAHPADVGGPDQEGLAEKAADGQSFNLYVAANPRQTGRIRGFADKTTDILQFYTSLLGDIPYDSFAVALTEAELPGGHSPPYFAIVNQPVPTTPFRWQNDPVAFQNYPTFFLAHEVAHQWWGQAVGWKNYHEQWLSEGFAQYFAALYAEHERGSEQFAAVLRQMRRTAMDQSSNGPISLGYRLGHLKGDSRIFRALVYNKGAMVLHMLRRLVGDDAFFRGLRTFYSTWRYKKAGTDDFRAAMEAASGQSLERFFDGWIFSADIPTLRFTSRVDGAGVHVAFDQLGEEVFDLPVTVTITYTDGSTNDVVVAVHDKRTERVIPAKGEVRSVDVNRDSATLADINRD